MRGYDWTGWQAATCEDWNRMFARLEVAIYAALHPEFNRALTSGERREQYADHYARTIMRLSA